MGNDFNCLKLPVEIWLVILEYLDTISLIKSTEVCNTFCTIVKTSQNLLNKIRLSINFNDEPIESKANDIVRILQSSQRQYTSICIKNSGVKCKELETIQILTKFCNKVKELSLEEYTSSPKAFACDFPNLEKLTLLSCEVQWMNVFSNCDQLTFLNIKKRLWKTLSKEDDNFVNFLLKQTCLKELVISGEINQLFKKNLSNEVPFRLHKLTINGDISFTDLKGSLEFFQIQNQLREVKICNIWWFAIENKEIFRQIFIKSTQLKSVEFTNELNFLPSYTHFLNGEFVHYGVETLSFTYIHYTLFLDKLFIVLAQLFPNVKIFCLKELNNLPIAHISCQCIYNVFPSIESLTISQMSNVNATVKVFCQKLPKLKNLKLSEKNFQQISAKTKVECQRAGVSLSC
ncbi:unnamed protein product [Diamesa serratosioi]